MTQVTPSGSWRLISGHFYVSTIFTIIFLLQIRNIGCGYILFFYVMTIFILILKLKKRYQSKNLLGVEGLVDEAVGGLVEFSGNRVKSNLDILGA